MKIDMSMTKNETQFTVSSWWAKDAAFAISAFRSQLQAAVVIFPELSEYKIVKKRRKKTSLNNSDGRSP